MTLNDNVRSAAAGLLADDTRNRVLVEWNGPRTSYPRDESVAALFAESAKSSPERPALVMPGAGGASTLTYAELDRRSSALAAELIGLGVAPGDTVGLFMGRALETVVAM